MKPPRRRPDTTEAVPRAATPTHHPSRRTPRRGARPGAELLMLAQAILIPAAGYALADAAAGNQWADGLRQFAPALTLIAVVPWVAIRRFAPCADPLLLPCALLLSGLSLMLLHRLDHAYAQRYHSDPRGPGQLLWICAGVSAFVLILLVVRHHRMLQRYTYLSAAVALPLLMAPAFFPGDKYGAKRWITMGGLSVQPGEYVKILIAVFFAGYLTHHGASLALTGRRLLGVRLPRLRQAGPVLTIWVVSLLVLVFERDLGTSLIFFALFIALLHVATQRRSWAVLGLVLGAAGAVVVTAFEPHVKGRVVAWLHPQDIFLPPGQRPPGLVSDQLAQAQFSFGAGGVTGTGLGHGHPELIKFAGRSDFILTTVGEELGAAGVMAVLLIYTIMVQRGLKTALSVSDPFGKLMAMALSAALGLQVFVVAGGVLGVIPFTGKVLPYLAQGGTSVMANWISLAILVRISHAARAPHRPTGLPPVREAEPEDRRSRVRRESA
ncbi:FtsW/RodA/SpoVE family cell cycle protein [Streptomyces sp. NPDC005865]|uniref:FtsW/RodA/SpoVE family cell cycle protein n=1 Tax=Streptomyces sp. NPDC005865 TaxID=3155453 RepID=UPI0033F86093